MPVNAANCLIGCSHLDEIAENETEAIRTPNGVLWPMDNSEVFLHTEMRSMETMCIVESVRLGGGIVGISVG
jgi:hypothetical protein